MNDWYEAEQHAERAHRFYEAGQWTKALDELHRALAVNPDQAEWHFGLGLTLDALERYGEAAAAYEQSLTLGGDDPQTLLHLGIAQVRDGKPEAGIQALTRCGEIDPEDPESYAHRILAYTQVGDHDSAELMFYLVQQHLDDEDEDPELAAIALDHMAHSLAIRDDLDRAVWCWQRCVALDPEAPQAHANLARAHWRAGRVAQSREHYLQQLRADPGDVGSLLELGTLLLDAGRRAEASEKFRRVLELDPTVAEAHLRLGELALGMGHTDAAKTRLDRARRLSPDLPGVYLGLARVARARGDQRSARRYARAELNRTGQSAPQVLELGRVLIELGLPQDADALLTPRLQAQPSRGKGRSPAPSPPLVEDPATRAAALLCRAVARFHMSEIAAGMADCRAVLRIEPTNLLAMQNLALASLGAGRLAHAAVWIRRAQRLAPNSRELAKLRRQLTRRRLLALLPWSKDRR